MRKILFTFLSMLFLCVMAVGFSACEHETYRIQVDGYTLQIQEDGTYSIIAIPTELTGKSTWEVPEQIGEYPISHLGAYYRVSPWYGPYSGPENLGRIRKLVLKSNIKSVYLDDFFNIKVLETEVPLSQIEFLADNPERTGVYCLSPYEENEDIVYITQENIVDNMVIVKNAEQTEAELLYAFGDNELIIPDTYQDLPITKIGREAFFNESFTSVTLGENINEIDEYAFCNLPIDSIDLKSVSVIGDFGFAYTPLKNVIFPSTVTKIGESCFVNSKIESFDLSASQITIIPVRAFSDNPLTGNLDFPQTLLEIESFAFNAATFREIILPDSLTEIESKAFANCNNLKKFVLPDSVVYFSASAVSGCDNLQTLHLGSIRSYSWTDSYNTKLLSLKEITVSENNQNLIVENGILYSKDKKTLYKCPTLLEIEKLTIDCETIYGWAFTGNSYIKEIECTSNVKEIQNGAFEDCLGLEKVELSQAVESIEFAVFRGCTALKTINTEFVKEFKNSCFHKCSSLQNVDFSSVLWVREWAFRECDFREVTLGTLCSDVERLAFADNVNLTKFDAGGAVIADNALYGTPIYQKIKKEKSIWEKAWDYLKFSYPTIL